MNTVRKGFRALLTVILAAALSACGNSSAAGERKPNRSRSAFRMTPPMAAGPSNSWNQPASLKSSRRPAGSPN